MRTLKRTQMSAARAWRSERESELRARIQLEESLLHSMRTELAELRALSDSDLYHLYGWESPVKVAESMRAKAAFEERITDMFCEAVLAGTW